MEVIKMKNQEINITEVKTDGVVIEEKMTYEKNVGQLKDEIRDLEYRKQSILHSMLQMKKEYKSFEERQNRLNEIIAEIEAEERPQTIDDIFENL